MVAVGRGVVYLVRGWMSETNRRTSARVFCGSELVGFDYSCFYIFTFIHDLPHRIAKKRNRPQQEAIHYACWLSLFTLHAIWPLVFMWSVSNRGPLRISVAGVEGAGDGHASRLKMIEQLQARLVAIESRFDQGRS